MESALIIFVRNPVLGKVKSRLAETVGAENALKIYKTLLKHTHSIIKNLPVHKYVFYADYIDHDDLWENNIYKKEIQTGSDLGERMKNAFGLLFAKDYKKVSIIGSDCYELSEGIILSAFDKLKSFDVIIGPATDGGYYLLGMNFFISQLFENKDWSTNTVYSETLEQLQESNYSVHQLEVLNDVDEIKDVTFAY